MIQQVRNILFQSIGFGLLSGAFLVPAFVCSLVKSGHPTARKFYHKWAVSIQKLVDLKVNVDDRRTNDIIVANRPGSLYVHLNQQTLLSMVLYTLMLENKKISYIMNYEFALIPLIGWTQYFLGGYAIVRQDPTQSKNKLNEAVMSLRKGNVIGISIEGKRCDASGELSPYKKGPVVMAIEAQCDIVPFMTLGEMKVWPFNSVAIIPNGTIDCVIFPPISMKGLTYDNRDEIVNTLRNIADVEFAKWKLKNKV